jgi:hypothetical protein
MFTEHRFLITKMQLVNDVREIIAVCSKSHKNINTFGAESSTSKVGSTCTCICLLLNVLSLYVT